MKVLAVIFTLSMLYLSHPTSGVIREFAWEPPTTYESCLDMVKKHTLRYEIPAVAHPGAELYIPYMSRLFLNRISAAILGVKIEDLKESSLYYDSCLKVKIESLTSLKFIGFGGKSVEYKMEFKEGQGEGRYYRDGAGKDDGGYVHFTKSDNQSYIFLPSCTFDERRSWFMISTKPELLEFHVLDAINHAMKMGFRIDYMTRIRYHLCK